MLVSTPAATCGAALCTKSKHSTCARDTHAAPINPISRCVRAHITRRDYLDLSSTDGKSRKVSPAPSVLLTEVSGGDASARIWHVYGNECIEAVESVCELHRSVARPPRRRLLGGFHAECVSTGRYWDGVTLTHWHITANVMFYKTLRQRVRRTAVGPELRGGGEALGCSTVDPYIRKSF